MEYTLLDFMAAGSSVAELQFDLAIIALLKRRNAHLHSIMLAEGAAQARGKQIRTKVFKHAFKELRNIRRSS